MRESVKQPQTGIKRPRNTNDDESAKKRSKKIRVNSENNGTR